MRIGVGHTPTEYRDRFYSFRASPTHTMDSMMRISAKLPTGKLPMIHTLVSTMMSRTTMAAAFAFALFALASGAQATDVRHVMVGGRLVVADGALADMSEADVLADADRERARLLARAGLSDLV